MNISYRGNPFSTVKEMDLPLHTGLKVPLLAYAEQRIIKHSPEWNNLVDSDLKHAQTIDSTAVRRHLPTICYNCHGMSLATRRGWLNEADLVLNNENYKVLGDDLDTIFPGDLVAYYELSLKGDYPLSHTGIVANVENNSTPAEVYNGQKTCQVISKWGMLGEFIHQVIKSPYGSSGYKVKFFRFVRTHY